MSLKLFQVPLKKILFYPFHKLLKYYIDTQLAKETGLSMTVEKVHIDPFKGVIAINNITIYHPTIMNNLLLAQIDHVEGKIGIWNLFFNNSDIKTKCKRLERNAVSRINGSDKPTWLEEMIAPPLILFLASGPSYFFLIRYQSMVCQKPNHFTRS